MSSYRFVIHVGYPKAASTALQKALFSSRVELKKNGVLYSDALLDQGSSKHEELFRLVRLNKVKRALKTLKEELDATVDIHTVFLSTESIINQLDNIDDSVWVELFQGLKCLGDVEVLVVYRESNSFLKSYYKQAVINQKSTLMTFYGTSLTLNEFSKLSAVTRLMDCHWVINKLESVSNATVKVFDYNDNVVSDVFRWLLGNNAEVVFEPRSNKSLQAEEVELIRQLNTTGLAPEQRNAWLYAMSYCCPLSSSTASILASRASADDLMSLEASWLMRIQLGMNPELGVNDEELQLLAKKIYQWLYDYQSVNKIYCPLDSEDQMLMSLKAGDSVELNRCVAKKLNQMSFASSNISLGETLFTKKRLELAPFKAVQFSGWGEWEQDPLDNRSWQWRLHWLSFLSYLMAYHRTVGDDGVLECASEAIQSWLDTYLETDASYPFEFIWHDHATALRAEQLVLFAYYCREHAPGWANQNVEFLAYLERALIVHAQWLVKDSFYSEHTNHGLEQARVLLLLGTVFDGEHALEWQKVAIRRISNELDFAFTDEGVHVENSPAYHVFVFKVFLGIVKDYPDEVLGDLAEQFSQFSAKALNFITHILRPDGKLPPIGDTEQLPTSDAYQDVFGHRLEYQYFLYALTRGKQGMAPPVLNRVYPSSGYAIFRDQWPAKEHYHKAFHLIAKVGCSSRYHHQQDEGHISLYAGGEDWLIDSGMYNYINKDPVRKYMRTRPGHNVPIISHTGYAEEFDHRLGAWQVSEYSEVATKPYIAMKIDVLHPVVHERRVEFDARTKIVEVEDQIAAGDDQPRNITLQWHIPKDKTITIEGNEALVKSPLGNQLRIGLEGVVPDSISVVKGQKNNRVFSCISYKANQVEPSQLLRILFKGRSNLRITTRFEFELDNSQIVPALDEHNANVRSMAGANHTDQYEAADLEDSRLPLHSSREILDDSVWATISRYVEAFNPDTVLQFGVSDFTARLARKLKSVCQGHLMCVLEDSDFSKDLRIERAEFRSDIMLVTSDIVDWPYRYSVGENIQLKQWFPDAVLESLPELDWVIIDGPDWQGNVFSRYPALPSVIDRLAQGAEVWMLGADDSRVLGVVRQWCEDYPVSMELVAKGQVCRIRVK